MTPRLHILTACSRPEHLGRVADSLHANLLPDFELFWHVGFDPDRCEGGHRIKNRLLEQVRDGWVWVLDDDNLMMPGFTRYMLEAIRAHPLKPAIAFSQLRSDGAVLRAAPSEMRVGHVDQAQVLVRCDFIGSLRLREDIYEADGFWIESLYRKDPGAWLFIQDVRCFHNRLRQ